MAGGMTMVGIPRYRLPREVIDREVAMIEDLGVEFVYNTRFGEDLSYDDLKKEGFEAFLFAIGAHKAYKLNIPGEDDFPQVIDAVELLKDVALGHRHEKSKKVVIIGGGNVAVDITLLDASRVTTLAPTYTHIDYRIRVTSLGRLQPVRAGLVDSRVQSLLSAAIATGH